VIRLKQVVGNMAHECLLLRQHQLTELRGALLLVSHFFDGCIGLDFGWIMVGWIMVGLGTDGFGWMDLRMDHGDLGHWVGVCAAMNSSQTR
jgi:hypothetical protein